VSEEHLHSSGDKKKKLNHVKILIQITELVDHHFVFQLNLIILD